MARQIGLHDHAMVRDSLFEMLHRAADGHFMRNEHTAIWRVAQSVDEALQLAMSTPLWDTQVRKFAAI